METKKNLNDLKDIIAHLRDPQNGCPWDKVQTHSTLKKNLVEETYEVIDALDLNDPFKIKDELGDLLLQIMLHTQIESEKNNFSIDDVIDNLSQKMIRRHPHIFPSKDFNVTAKTSEDVDRIWAKVKEKEKRDTKTETVHLLDQIPSSFPPFLKAYKLGKKASQVGFDWETEDDALKKIDEELLEVKEEAKKGKDRIEFLAGELGDLLFVTIQYIRKLELDPNTVLEKTCKKFKNRFNIMEELATKGIENYSPKELDDFYNIAKESLLKKEKSSNS